MTKNYSASEMGEIDRRSTQEFGIPSMILMENAGLAVADVVEEYSEEPPRVLVVAGKGKNGGDALVAARHLFCRGYQVSISLVFAKTEFRASSDEAMNLSICEKLGINFNPNPEACDTILDGIFGTGLTRPVDGAALESIRKINRLHSRGALVIAIDVPSGLNCDTGQPMPEAVFADVTVTMGAMKTGLERAERYTGDVVIANITFPPQLLR